MPYVTHSRVDGLPPAAISRSQYESELLPLKQQNASLQTENDRLRTTCQSLTSAAESWIRLYECALARARRAESRLTSGGR
jgi:hypothetical protein